MGLNLYDNFSGLHCCLFDVTLYLCTCPRFTRALLRSPIQTSTDALAEVLMVKQAIDGSALVNASMPAQSITSFACFRFPVRLETTCCIWACGVPTPNFNLHALSLSRFTPMGRSPWIALDYVPKSAQSAGPSLAICSIRYNFELQHRNVSLKVPLRTVTRARSHVPGTSMESACRKLWWS